MERDDERPEPQFDQRAFVESLERTRLELPGPPSPEEFYRLLEERGHLAIVQLASPPRAIERSPEAIRRSQLAAVAFGDQADAATAELAREHCPSGSKLKGLGH